MTYIYLDKKPVNFADYILSYDNEELFVTVVYASGKKYNRPYEEWTIEPSKIKDCGLLYQIKTKTVHKIERAIEVGDKYFLIKYPNSDKEYIMLQNEVLLTSDSKVKDSEVFSYFHQIAEERLRIAGSEKDRVIANNVVKQFDKIAPFEKSALHSYLNQSIRTLDESENLIYPFSLNETQLEAVRNAFSSQISIIEGPPGTGKTQTILNIIANIIIKGMTCAIVSNNNSAVENVYDKLKKNHLGFLIAEVGNDNKKQDFFACKHEKEIFDNQEVSLETITKKVNEIERYLSSKNRLAELECFMKEITIEKDYLEEWYRQCNGIENDITKKYHLSSKKTIDLIAYLRSLSNQFLSFKNKMELLLHYHIFKSKVFNDLQVRQEIIYSLQKSYYDKLIEEYQNEKGKLENILSNVKFDETLTEVTKLSMQFLYQYTNETIPKQTNQFTKNNYKKKFSDFMKRYPIIGSSTHSLLNSIGDGYILDYIIIDEASQQDIVPGILCLGCARNIVIVGDRKQLPHIPVPTDLQAPNAFYDCYRYSLLDSFCFIFSGKVPCTLLKEHYRCHPKIIQFCNKQFYDNQLIPMKKDCGEQSMRLVITATGNHARYNMNQREIDSILEISETSGFLSDGVGFIAPFNDQVNLGRKYLPAEVAKDTIHKFQGRECDEIFFSTVLDEKRVSKQKLSFVDNGSLINVAVSRAIQRFTLVTGKEVFKTNQKHIAALIRYIEYYASEESIFDSPVISAFDLLYSEYDKSLEKLNARLKKSDSKYRSEQIIARLLSDILQLEQYDALTYHKQIYLRQLVDENKVEFNQQELDFMKHGASCDFVLYFKVGKKPFGVIEVDGSSHLKEEQIRRDHIKNAILEKVGIPLLRLPTTSSKIEEKINNFIDVNLHEE